ncbi:MAG: HlyD family type I secretion periplasmic adaptor subunit [Planctomycetota bacterium]
MSTVKEERIARRREARLEAHRQRASKDRTLIEFQPDAVEIEKRSVPGGARWTLYTVILLLIGVVAWSYWAQVDKIVTANGKLVTVEQPVVIQTSLTAPIMQMHAQFGDHVSAGDPLVTLDSTLTIADVTAMRALVNSLSAAESRLLAESDGVEFLIPDEFRLDVTWLKQMEYYLERQNEYNAKMKEFESERSKLEVQQDNNELEIALHTANLREYRDLEEKYINLERVGSASEVRVLSARISRRDAQTKLMTAENRARELEAEVEALEKRIAAFDASWKAKTAADLVETLRQKQTADQDLAKAENQSRQVEICVPEDMEHEHFMVFEVADRSPGSVVQPGEPLYKLIPLNSSYEAEIEVEGKDIALIREGSTVRVKLSTFPYQKHGTLDGEIRFISEGVFENQNQAGQSASTYKARVRLVDPITLEAVPEDFRLMPGMTTTCEIKVGRRRVLDYFLYPLLRFLDESLDEP